MDCENIFFYHFYLLLRITSEPDDMGNMLSPVVPVLAASRQHHGLPSDRFCFFVFGGEPLLPCLAHSTLAFVSRHPFHRVRCGFLRDRPPLRLPLVTAMFEHLVKERFLLFLVASCS